MCSAFDVKMLNATLKETEYAVASLGTTFHTVKNDVLHTWTWVNIMEKASQDEAPHHYTTDASTLQHVQHMLQVSFPSDTFHIFQQEEIENVSLPNMVLAVCLSKEKLPTAGQYT